MRKPLLLAAFAVIAIASYAHAEPQPHAKHNRDDIRAVKKVIVDAYVVGGHTNGDTAAMRAGFHDDFVMKVRGDNGTMRQITRDQWLARIDKHNAEAPKPRRKNVSHKFLMVDVTGDVAVAKVALYKDAKLVFTDYMSLYRFDDGWKIVAKVFQPHGK